MDAYDDDDDPTPQPIRGKGNETAFWGIARRELKQAGVDRDGLAVDVEIAIADIIGRQRTVGWQHDRDAQNRIRNAIDDYFFGPVMRPGGLTIDPAVIDSITDDILAAARV